LAKRRLADRCVGDLGEDDLRRWCTLHRLKRSKPEQDRLGWDYFIEFEPEVDNAVPLDRQSDLKKVLVQVKSTDRPSRSVRGKLSAFKHLVDADLPAFIAHIDYSGQQEPRRAVLLHIGPTQIEAILHKVRKTEKAGRVDLHNVDMTLSLAEAAEIEAGGGNFRQLILEAIQHSGAEYVAAKAACRKACGYDEHSINAEFTLAPGTSGEALVDLMIGKVPSIPISEMVISKTRFGITLDKDIDHIAAEGTLSVGVRPLQQGKVTASDGNQHRRIEMTVDVFAPGIPGLPKSHMKVRLANKFINLFLHFGEGSSHMQFRIDPEMPHPIDRLANALGFGLMLSEDGARLDAHFKGLGVISMLAPPDARQFRHWRVLHEFADMLSVVLFRHRRGTTVEVTLREMEEMLRANINMFALLTRPGLEMTFAPSEGSLTSFPTSAAIFIPTCIEFRSLAYFAIVRVEAELTSQEGSIRFIGGRPHVVEDGVIERSDLRVSALNDRATELGKQESSKDQWVLTTTLADSHQ
jgi:hypothetical protein